MYQEDFTKLVDETIESTDNLVEMIEIVAELEIPDSSGFSTNAQVLADYISELQFDWDNESYENRDDFVSESAAKVKQILADIKSGNQYRKLFSVELAYSRLKSDNYDYKFIHEKLSAETTDEALSEKEKVRINAPKQHPEDDQFTLEDARLRVKVIDQNNKTVLEEKFLLN
jgi:hypothetical protein